MWWHHLGRHRGVVGGPLYLSLSVYVGGGDRCDGACLMGIQSLLSFLHTKDLDGKSLHLINPSRSKLAIM